MVIPATGRFLRRHAIVLLVLAAAVGLRVAVLAAYPYAFYFPDSRGYVTWSAMWQPHRYRPIGYSVFLNPFVPGRLHLVPLVQHLIGLGLVVAGYALLVRRGVRPWLAALAVVPVAADAMQLTLEHFVASETLFTALLSAGLLVLLWRPRVPAVAAGVAGLLLAAAVLTRTVGQPVVLLVLVFVVVKLLLGQAGWRAALAYPLAVAAPLVAYLLWFHHVYGVYAFDQLGGRALYSRVMTVADCERLDLTDRQRLLCVPEPPSERPDRPDYWGWNPDSPARKYFRIAEEDTFMREFGLDVIGQQPGDYARVVAEETWWHFWPQAPLSEETLCLLRGWRLPEHPSTPCNAAFYTPTERFEDEPEIVAQPSTPLRSALADYNAVTSAVRGPVLGLALLVVLAAAAWRSQRSRSGRLRDSADALLLAAVGFGLILGSVAFGMYDPRYAVTSALLIPLAAGLALRRREIHEIHPPAVSIWRRAARRLGKSATPDEGTAR